MNPLFSQKIYHETICGICQDEFEKNNPSKCALLACGHIFHQKCAKPWVKSNQSCPSCRKRSIIPVPINKLLREGIKEGYILAKITLAGLGIIFASFTMSIEFSIWMNKLMSLQNSLNPEVIRQALFKLALLIGLTSFSLGALLAVWVIFKRIGGPKMKRFDYTPQQFE